MSITEAEAREILHSRGLRVTRPRVAVLLVLADAALPLSHGDVLERLAASGWDPATVYRNLIKLRDAGIAPVVSRAEGIDRYAFAAEHGDDHRHPHFYCEECGQLACVPAELTISLTTDDRWAESVRRAMVQLRGACPDCLA